MSIVDPRLPIGIERLCIEGLMVGDETVNLVFEQHGERIAVTSEARRSPTEIQQPRSIGRAPLRRDRDLGTDARGRRGALRIKLDRKGGPRRDTATDRERRPLIQDLELFPIGNCASSALIDAQGRYVWACAPRIDGDPFFCALVGGGGTRPTRTPMGLWAVDVEDQVEVSQAYRRNTPILRTEITAIRN